MVYALDTNCLVRWLLGDNVAQAKVVEGYLNQPGRNLHVADLAIIETAWVLKSVYEFDEVMIGRFIEKILQHRNINCNRALFQNVLKGMHGRPKISLTDLCLAYYAKLSDADKLLTFDKTFAKRLPDLVELAG